MVFLIDVKGYLQTRYLKAAILNLPQSSTGIQPWNVSVVHSREGSQYGCPRQIPRNVDGFPNPLAFESGPRVPVYVIWDVILPIFAWQQSFIWLEWSLLIQMVVWASLLPTFSIQWGTSNNICFILPAWTSYNASKDFDYSILSTSENLILPSHQKLNIFLKMFNQCNIFLFTRKRRAPVSTTETESDFYTIVISRLIPPPNIWYIPVWEKNEIYKSNPKCQWI